MVKNVTTAKSKILAAEKALFFFEQNIPDDEDKAYICMVRGTLSEAMELLDNAE